MYKTRSKFLQRSRDISAQKASGKTAGRKPESDPATRAKKANERRAPFFYRIKRTPADGENDLPGWLQVEIREAGGTRGWLKRNAYWQKRLRGEYYLVVAETLDSGRFKKSLPSWLVQEVRSFGRVHWLKVHAGLERKKDLRATRSTASPKHQHTGRRVVVPHPINTWLDGVGEKSLTPTEDKGRKKRPGKSAPTYKPDALDRAMLGGGFDTNRRRH